MQFYGLPLFFAIVPSLILVWYFYRQDRIKPEPKGLIVKIFILGILSTLPALVLEIILSLFKGLFNGRPVLFYFFNAFIIAALCEEWIKMQVVKFFAYNRREFDEVMDGIVYTIVASLGFACLENILYVAEGGISVALVRAFTAVPLHAVCSGIMGFSIGKAKFCGNRFLERKLFMKGLLYAILIHGSYNFLLFLSAHFNNYYLGILNIPILIIVFLILRKKIKTAINDDIQSGRV